MNPQEQSERRRSSSAEASRRKEIERLRRLSPKERALLALELGHRCDFIERRLTLRRAGDA